jgi:formate dehydrogenase subunit gamma
MIVMDLLARIRLVLIAVMLFAIAAIAPAVAQKVGPDGAPNPTASVTSERALLKQMPRAEGRIDIPDTKAGVPVANPIGLTTEEESRKLSVL